ncbi:hypothetical protein VPH35_136019 [Triticum aestivum]|uniref:uncharacterized protein n=1 Tax=Triticum aestivum TaxID=4565 RepID=UPI0008445561|nr:uncharacterized protein LOC123163877 [Triticum aestivum]
MPALALRPLPMATRMGTVRALSAAAGSRFMSHGAPERQMIYPEKVATLLEETKRNQAQADQYLKDTRKKLAILDELQRPGWCDPKVNFHDELRKLEKTCDIALLILVPAILMLFMAVV